MESRNKAKLDRYEMEAVARAILSGERKLKPALNKVADQAASLMSQFLYAQGVPGRFRTEKALFGKEEVLIQLGKETLKQIFSRVRKLVPVYAEKDELNG